MSGTEPVATGEHGAGRGGGCMRSRSIALLIAATAALIVVIGAGERGRNRRECGDENATPTTATNTAKATSSDVAR